MTTADIEAPSRQVEQLQRQAESLASLAFEEGARLLAVECIANVLASGQTPTSENVKSAIAKRSPNVTKRYANYSDVTKHAQSLVDGMLAQNAGWRLD